jgi:diamine N-acetyltransferase
VGLSAAQKGIIMSAPVEIIFQLARLEHVDVVVSMMRALEKDDPNKKPFDERLRRVAYADFLTAPSLGSIWLLEVNRELVGYLVLAFAFSFEFGGRNAFIDELYVVPEYRRRGIGRQALQFAVRAARQGGVSALHLEVSPKNLAALELYRRAEFLDHDRYLMTRWLTEEASPG